MTWRDGQLVRHKESGGLGRVSYTLPREGVLVVRWAGSRQESWVKPSDVRPVSGRAEKGRWRATVFEPNARDGLGRCR